MDLLLAIDSVALNKLILASRPLTLHYKLGNLEKILLYFSRKISQFCQIQLKSA